MARHYVRLHTRSKYKDKSVGQPQVASKMPLPSKALKEIVDHLREKHPTAEEVRVKRSELIVLITRTVLNISFNHAYQLGLVDEANGRVFGFVEVRITAELEDHNGRIFIQSSKVKGGKRGGLRWLPQKMIWQSPRCKSSVLRKKVTTLLSELEQRDGSLSPEFTRIASSPRNELP